MEAARTRDDEVALAAFDVIHGPLAARRDAMVAPLRPASLVLDEAGKQGCDVSSVMAAVRAQAPAER